MQIEKLECTMHYENVTILHLKFHLTIFGNPFIKDE